MASETQVELFSNPASAPLCSGKQEMVHWAVVLSPEIVDTLDAAKLPQRK
jgi:hypothetical protein